MTTSGHGWYTKTPHLPPSKHPTSIDIAWAAGIYEGEGSCQNRYGTSGTSHVRVFQKDAWLLHKLRDLFGGRVSPVTQKRTTAPEERVTYHRWDIYGARARGFGMTIYTFLSPRRQKQLLPMFTKIRSL